MGELVKGIWLLFKHLSFFGGALAITFLISLQFMSEVKEIPFIPQNLCDRTYYTSDTRSNPSYEINRKGKVEFNLNERTTGFSQYMSKDRYEKRGPEEVHWAYAQYSICIDHVNEYLKEEGISEDLKKKGRFPPSCSEYSKCGGKLVEKEEWETSGIKSKEGNSFSLSTSSGYKSHKITLYELEESGEMNKPFVIILIFFYLTFVFGWRYVKKKLSDI